MNIFASHLNHLFNVILVVTTLFTLALPSTVIASESSDFKHAQQRNTVAGFESFLQRYPQSKFSEQVIYARDKLIFRKAQRDSSPKSVSEFLQNYPTSPWRAEAERALAIRDGSFSANSDTPTPRKSRYQTPIDSNDSDNDRVLKALNTYSERRQQKEKAKHDKQEEEKKIAAKQRKCQKMKDQIDIYEEGRRWYNLDNSGERIFLDDQQTEQLGKYYRNSYQQECGN